MSLYHLVLTALLLCPLEASADIQVESVMVMLRDGVKLATDVYRDDAIQQAPVILMRTPYDRTKQKATGVRWAKAGYVFVAQDCRGTRESEGVIAPYNNEGQDGFDTLEWITRQSWCSGRVGMVGGSYVGAVQWQAAVEHPPGLAFIAPQATWSSFCRNLHLGGAVRLSLISGWLAGNTPKPEGLTPADTFHADPAKPVPACPVTETRPLKSTVWGPVDQRALEDRDDVLVYTSDKFSEPLSFAGNIEAKLFVSADTPDADWAVKLVDVRPDGFAQNLATGILRGRYHESLHQASLLEPGKIYEITVDLGPCAATIANGHRLRVDSCGSLYPLYDRNPNTGEGPLGSKTLISMESVYHSPLKASRVVLPVKQ